MEAWPSRRHRPGASRADQAGRSRSVKRRVLHLDRSGQARYPCGRDDGDGITSQAGQLRLCARIRTKQPAGKDRKYRTVIRPALLSPAYYPVKSKKETRVVQGARNGRIHWPRRTSSGGGAGPHLHPSSCRTRLPRLRRQITSTREWLPPGFYVAGYYWDVESGALDLEQRGHGSYEQFTAQGIPRDGGLADLLAEAQSPQPRFAAVVVEDIERASRDFYNSVKLERQLSDQGIPLFATDEPADITGVNPTTLLIRRVKQGFAEFFRLQLKDKTWKGLKEHTAARMEPRQSPLRIPARTHHPPQPVQSRPGPHQNPPRTRPGPRPHRGADLHLASRRQARHQDHHGPAERRPGRLPAPRPGHRVDHRRRGRHAPQPQVHRVPGDRAPPPGQARPHRISGTGQLDPATPPSSTGSTWDAAQQVGAEHATSWDGTRPLSRPRGGPTRCGPGCGARSASGGCAAPPRPTRPGPGRPTPTTCASTTRPTPAMWPPPPTTPAPSPPAKTSSCTCSATSSPPTP